MGWFKKNTDPISDRERALSAEIAALEAQIKQLDGKVEPGPRLRSTALPHGVAALPASSHIHNEPIFEDVNQSRLKAREVPETTEEHYNDLGVRKYDLAAVLRRLKNNFRGPATANPKLVNYLAAGSIQGLRPMRYEKRIARNRFLAVVIGILLVLIGIFKYIHG